LLGEGCCGAFCIAGGGGNSTICASMGGATGGCSAGLSMKEAKANKIKALTATALGMVHGSRRHGLSRRQSIAKTSVDMLDRDEEVLRAGRARL
jgi:hypothetical protein